MLRKAGLENDIELVWEYLEDVVAPLVKRLYKESTSAIKLSQEFSAGTLNVWENLMKNMSNFTSREVNM